MKYILSLSLFGSIFLLSCNKSFDGLQDNPNYPSPSTANVDLYLNHVQNSFNTFLGGTQNVFDQASFLTRQLYFGGPLYQNGTSPTNYDNEWEYAYSNIINNANALIPLAESQKLYIQAGIARVLEAYTYGTLVDQFGDVPFIEAGYGSSNINPKADKGAVVYAGVQTLLDSAIADFSKTGANGAPLNDLFYNGATAKWISAAKTLKLKFYLQTRLVDNTVNAKIQALLTENNLINASAQDFVFQYGKQSSTPDSRNFHYAADYTSSGVGDYIGNYFMWMVTAQKWGGVVKLINTPTSASGDPRARYYFYRQTTDYSSANASTCPCYASSVYGSSTFPAWYPSVPDQSPFCVIGKGYWGKDHGDNTGAPPDGSYRTAYGIYPAGGEFDANQAKKVADGMGAGGNGILPIWLSSYTYFLEAEAALTMGITSQGTARSLLQKGVDASIQKVINFPAKIGYSFDSLRNSYVPNATQITNYENLVLSNYDTCTTDAQRLNIIMSEYYIALWGNGMEPYNNLRRTGMPNNMQPMVDVANPGIFIRSFLYPSNYIERNLNALPQKTPGVSANKVFWDNNPDNFIK